MDRALVRAPDERVNRRTSIPFFLVHLLPLLAIFMGVTWRAVILGLALFWGRMFFITAGYHRYFSHKSYRLNRFWQFVMAFGGTTCAQKGPLWWAAHHRNHHRFSDTDRDIHSPQKGFWWSHVGWILCDKYNESHHDQIKDFAKYPELRFLDRHDWIGPWTLGVASYLIAGWPGLLVGFFGSTVLLWHSTFTVNSLAHVMGRRRYATPDTSRNSLSIALLTMGEGWHNNHHYFPASARQGFFWWEVDGTYYVLRALSLVGIVKDLKAPPARVRAAGRVKDGAFDLGMFRAHWRRATAALANVAPWTHDDEPAVEPAGTHAAVDTAPVATSPATNGARDGDDLDAEVAARRKVLQELTESAMRSADELAALTKRRRRERVLAD